MTGLDTNVLVRYLTQDDPAQTKKATALVEEAAAKDDRMLVHPVVLCELVWVLETAYDFTREEVVPVLDRILRTAQFEIPEKEVVWSAWNDYRLGKGDFADYLIGRANERLGVQYTVTFDRGLDGCSRFKVL
jgi:predicted nucleic-acid-binding protein